VGYRTTGLPDFPWDTLAPHAAVARSHPDGIVDLSVGTPVDPTPEPVRAALAAAGKPGEIVVYDGAPHGFHADYRPSYREAAAKDGWQRLQAWFERHGVA